MPGHRLLMIPALCALPSHRAIEAPGRIRNTFPVSQTIGCPVQRDFPRRAVIAILLGIVTIAALVKIAFTVVRPLAAHHAKQFPLEDALAHLGREIAGIQTDSANDQIKAFPYPIQASKIGLRGLFNLMDFKVPRVGVDLEVGAVSVEHAPTNQLVRNGMLNDPVKDALLDVRSGKPAAPILAHGRGVRDLVGQPETKEPAVRDIDFDFLDHASFGANPEQVTNEQHLEQHHRINRRAAVVLAVQALCRFANEIKPDVLVEQAEQMILRDQLLQRHHLHFRLDRVGRLEQKTKPPIAWRLCQQSEAATAAF